MASRDSKTGKFVKKAEADAQQAGPDQVTFEPQGRESIPTAGAADLDRDQMAEQYPTKALSAADKADRVNLLKYDLTRADGMAPGVTPYGKLTFDDQIAHWLLRKEEAAKAAKFERWFAENFDKWGDANKAIARKLFKKFYADRVKTARENCDLMYKLMRIRIRGVESQEDLALKFAAENNLLPLGQLENLLHPEGERQANAFRRGLLNTNTMWFPQHGGSTRYFTGDPDVPVGSAAGGAQPLRQTNAGWMRQMDLTPNV